MPYAPSVRFHAIRKANWCHANPLDWIKTSLFGTRFFVGRGSEAGLRNEMNSLRNSWNETPAGFLKFTFGDWNVLRTWNALRAWRIVGRGLAPAAFLWLSFRITPHPPKWMKCLWHYKLLRTKADSRDACPYENNLHLTIKRRYLSISPFVLCVLTFFSKKRWRKDEFSPKAYLHTSRGRIRP